MDKKLKERLIKTRKAVKRKLQAFKEGAIARESELEKTYEPITKKIRELYDVSSSSIKQEKVKTEPEDDVTESLAPPRIHESNKLLSESIPRFIETETTFESEGQQEEEEDEEEDNGIPDENLSNIMSESISQVAWQEYLQQYDPLPRYYIEGLITDTADTYDQSTGVKHDAVLNKFTLGNFEIDFEGKDILINNIRYNGTPGLYELIFKKDPLGYKKSDEKDYQDILNRTNIHRRNYDPNEQLRGNRSQKYLNIIKPLAMRSAISSPVGATAIASLTMAAAKKKQITKPVMSTASAAAVVKKTIPTGKKITAPAAAATAAGRGLFMSVSENPVDYVYYKDPNDLVIRLKKIHAAKVAGNNSLDNEYASLIDELKESNIIY